jgi:TP53 regulating kinase-like protein
VKLIQKGAEAELFLDEWHGLKVVRKVRVPKRYRISSLDLELRRIRTAHEAWIMHEARKAGVATPIIYLVDLEMNEIVMQYIEGSRLREFLEDADTEARIRFCSRLGEAIGKLHKIGIVHGDLTTSNAIVKESKIFLIDFGLAEYSRELEKKGIDLLLGQRVFHSTHHAYGTSCYTAFLKGYREQVGQNVADQVEDRVKDIAQRGRYAIER